MGQFWPELLTTHTHTWTKCSFFGAQTGQLQRNSKLWRLISPRTYGWLLGTALLLCPHLLVGPRETHTCGSSKLSSVNPLMPSQTLFASQQHLDSHTPAPAAEAGVISRTRCQQGSLASASFSSPSDGLWPFDLIACSVLI